MPHILRFGVQFDLTDPFWVQVHEAVLQAANRCGALIVPLDVSSSDAYTISPEEQVGLVEEFTAQAIDAFICQGLPDTLAERILRLNLPIIALTESDFSHPLFVSPRGLYEAAYQAGTFLAEKLGGRGRVLMVGGGVHGRGEDGQSRVAGMRDCLRAYPEISLRYLPSLWMYEQAEQQIRATAWSANERFEALFGLSDSIALAARHAGLELGLLDSQSLVIGINGDPLALAAILEGNMTATVQTSATDLAEQAVSLAERAVRRETLPKHFSFKSQFVTAENVSEIAAQKLIAIASFPTRLIGDNRRQAQQRLAQLETSLKINRHVGVLLDRHQLLNEITRLIQVSYGYDQVQIFSWNEASQGLVLENQAQPSAEPQASLDAGGVLAETLRRRQPIFIPDTLNSQRFQPDPAWPHTRSRVILPIQLGERLLGLLDLHSRMPRQHARQELIGLQSLADQLGMAMRNAELYSEAVQARATAERANQLKTRLLANVSHELRTPLNVILGYAATALASPNPYQANLPASLLRDVQHIYASGEHLLRLINDLLDLSRAEIDALELFPETIDVQPFLADVFHSLADSLPTASEVKWRLQVPERLPMIQADPLRLRQILLNLLSNAHKFTTAGEIVLGAEVAPPHLVLWIKDTGPGIPLEQQEQIFEPFATSLQTRRRNEGVGLGLTITRRLVLLHGGSLTLESQPGLGSTFRVYMPLPNLGDKPVKIPENAQPVLVAVSGSHTPPAAISQLCQQYGWAVQAVQSEAQLNQLLSTLRPAALAWDLAHATLDDWALIQKLKSVPQLAQLPFILYGSGATPDLGVGVTNFLVKPLGQQTLLETINALRPAAHSGLILIVDDDAQARALYAQIVSRALPNFTVQTVESGAQALKLLENITPTLVILDLIMPEVDGFAVLEAMRARLATRRVPVLVMSGRTLAFEDVRRLNQMYVTFHSKNILSETETEAALQHALSETEALPPQTSAVVKHAIAYIHQNYSRPISRQALASTVGVSKDYLSHIFQQELGLSPWEFLTRYRIQHAKLLLQTSHASITHIAAQVGFEDLSYFNRVFRKQVGCSPTAYRQQGPRS